MSAAASSLLALTSAWPRLVWTDTRLRLQEVVAPGQETVWSIGKKQKSERACDGEKEVCSNASVKVEHRSDSLSEDIYYDSLRPEPSDV